MPKIRKQHKTEDPPRQVTAAIDPVATPDQPRQRRKRGWLPWGVSLLVLFAALLLLAPTILTRTRARDYLLARIVPADAATVTIDSLRFGWWTPLRMTQFQLMDPQGQPMLEVDRIEGDRTLLQLASDWSQLGKFVVVAPTIHACLRANGSNLEDALAPWLEAPATRTPDSSSPMLAMSLEIVDGKVLATEQETNTAWNMEGLEAVVELPAGLHEPWQTSARGALNGQPFAFAASVPVGLGTADWPLGPRGSCTLTSDALPLQPLRYLARRAGQRINLEGALSMDFKLDWQAAANAPQDLPVIGAAGNASISNLHLVAPELLGQDTLELPKATLELELRAAEGLLSLRECALDSTLGQAKLTGAAAFKDLLGNDLLQGILHTLRTQAIAMQGHIDVATLARTLPTLFRIQDDIHLSSGQLAWEIANRVVPGSPTQWGGWARTQDVSVTQAGKPINWQFPLRMEFSISDGETLSVDKFTAESDFFQLGGQGTLAHGDVQCEADLQRFVAQLVQVVDLQGLDLRGGLQGRMRWQADEQNKLQADGKVQLSNFELVQRDQLIAREAQLSLVARATGQVTANALANLETARVDMISGGDLLAAELAEPVASPNSGSVWQLVTSLRGELVNWQSRLRTVGVDLGYELGGTIDATAGLTLQPASTTVKSLQGTIRNLTAVAEGIHVHEPIVRFSTAGAIDHTTLAARFPESMFASSSLSLGAKNVVVENQPAFTVAGDVGFRADLARLMQHLAASPDAQTYEGSAVGQLRLAAAENKTRFHLNGEVDKLVVRAPATPESPTATLWQEPKATLSLDGEYDAVRDHLAIDASELAGNSLRMNAQGSADKLMTQPVADLQGTVSYDLQSLLQAAKEYVGTEIRVSGQQREKFLLQGPLFPVGGDPAARVAEELQGQFGVAWDSADIYNVPLGAGRMDMSLSRGVLRWAPIHLPVGQGQVSLTPTLHVNTPALWMTVEPGLIAQNVHITPEMCKSWMRFIAPLMADATSAQGMFSVALSKTEVPLMQPLAGNVAGQLEIHGGALGPGPMAQQFLGIAQQVKQLAGKGTGSIVDPNAAWVELSPQQITFQLQDGRVYHEGFRMIVDGVPMQTRGFVGLDETLELQAQIPILDDWIAGQPALAGLRGQVVTIPMSGTISQPRLDQQALAQLSGQLVRQAARGYLEQEVGNQLQKQLQKLFQ